MHSSKHAYSVSHPLGDRSLSSFYTLAGQENEPCPFMNRDLVQLCFILFGEVHFHTGSIAQDLSRKHKVYVVGKVERTFTGGGGGG